MTVVFVAVVVVTAAAAGMLGAAIAQRVWGAVPIFALAVTVGLTLITAIALEVAP